MTEKYIGAYAFISTLREMQKEFCNWSRSFGKTATCVLEEAINKLQSFPTADVDPVVHAHWIFQMGVFANNGTEGCFECSACKATIDLETFGRMRECGQTRKCGACGARMDEEIVKDGQTE